MWVCVGASVREVPQRNKSLRCSQDAGMGWGWGRATNTLLKSQKLDSCICTIHLGH